MTIRWDIGNVLHMLSLEMRTWDLADVQVSSDGTVHVTVTSDETMAEPGVIRQLVEYAGGQVVEAAPEEARSGWRSFLEKAPTIAAENLTGYVDYLPQRRFSCPR